MVECFNAMYDRGPDFCKLIDSSVEGAQSLIDGLAERDKMPQIAVSVDMLDTGIDVPDAVNLGVLPKRAVKESSSCRWLAVARVRPRT